MISALPDIPTAAGTGLHNYVALDPGGGVSARYRLVEHQEPGRPDLSYGTCEVQDPGVPAGSEAITYNADSLDAVVAALNNPLHWESPPNPCVESAPVYAILCPDSFVTSLRSYASLWYDSKGVDARVVSFSQADSCYGGYQQYIRAAARGGTRFVLLVGDANDAAWWDDQSKWINGWTWPRVSPTGPHIPSQPQRNLIPTFYTADADSPGIAMSFYTPYYASDLPYADVDNDGLPDVVVGRLPAGTIADITAYTAKLSTYLSNGGGSSWSNPYELTYAQDNGDVYGDYLTSDADTLATAFPSAAGLIRYADTNSTGWSYSYRESLATLAANSGTDLVAWLSSGSQRYIYANFWRIDRGWSMAKLSSPARTGHFFLSLGLSCDMGNFDQSEYYASYDSVSGSFANPIRPIVERLLFDPGKGAIACIGPSRGSFQPGNAIFARELIRQLYSGGKNAGTAFLLAQRSAISYHPEYAALFRAYTFLGDPVIGSYSLTGVNDVAARGSVSLSGPWPNPFNPSTSLSLRLTAPSTVSLSVYDVHGRLVRRLLDHASLLVGTKRIIWDGQTEFGGAAGSGVYFARLEALDRKITRKLVLLR